MAEAPSNATDTSLKWQWQQQRLIGCSSPGNIHFDARKPIRISDAADVQHVEGALEMGASASEKENIAGY